MISYLEQLFSLRGKVAVVTGASRGIGVAIARGFSLAGAHVIGFGRSTTPEWDGNQMNVDLVYRICDITDEEQLKNQMNWIYKKEKRLDILVNAAGITLPINETDSKEKMLAKFDKMIQVNLLYTALQCCFLFLMHLPIRQVQILLWMGGGRTYW